MEKNKKSKTAKKISTFHKMIKTHQILIVSKLQSIKELIKLTIFQNLNQLSIKSQQALHKNKNSLLKTMKQHPYDNLKNLNLTAQSYKSVIKTHSILKALKTTIKIQLT